MAVCRKKVILCTFILNYTTIQKLQDNKMYTFDSLFIYHRFETSMKINITVEHAKVILCIFIFNLVTIQKLQDNKMYTLDILFIYHCFDTSTIININNLTFVEFIVYIGKSITQSFCRRGSA